MATRINTKFVIILAAALVVLTGSVVLAVLTLKKSAADHVRIAEQAMIDGAAALEAGNTNEANVFFEDAARHFFTAKNKDPLNTSHMHRFIEARMSMVYTDLNLATTEMQSLVQHATTIHDTPSATAEDRAYIYEMLHERALRGLVVDGTFGYGLMRQQADRRLVTSPNDPVAKRYASIAYGNLAEFLPDEEQRAEALELITTTLRDAPDDAWLQLALGRFHIGVALRIRATNDNRVTESFTTEHRLALPPLYRAVELAGDDTSALLESARLLSNVSPGDEATVEEMSAVYYPLMERLVERLSDKAARDGLTTTELTRAVELMLSVPENEQYPFDTHAHATALARAVVADRGDEPEAFETLGDALFNTSAFDEATEVYEQGLALERHTNSLQRLLDQRARSNIFPALVSLKITLADRAEEAGTSEALLQEAEALIERFASAPTTNASIRDAQANLLRGHVDYSAEQWEAAITHYRAANVGYQGQNLMTLQRLGACYANEAEYEQVIDIYNQIIELQPGTQLRRELARLYLRQQTDQSVELARLQLNNHLRLYPGDHQARALLANLMFDNNQQNDAVRMLEAMDLEQAPNLRDLLAFFKERMGDSTMSTELLEERLAQREEGEAMDPALVRQLVRLQPDLDARNAKIDELVQQGLDAGIAQIMRAFAVNNTLTLEQEVQLLQAGDLEPAELAIGLHGLYLRFDEGELATEQLDRASELDPLMPEVLTARFTQSLRASEWDDAQQVIDDILELEPSARPAYAIDDAVFLVAALEAARADMVEDPEARIAALRAAEDRYQGALSDNGNYTQGWVSLGQIQMILGDFAQAGDSFRQALALQRNNTAAIAMLAQVEAATGDQEQALERFERLFERDPSNITALNQITTLAQALGVPDRAIVQRERMLQLDPESLDNRRALVRLYGQRADEGWVGMARSQMDTVIQAEGLTRTNYELLVTVMLAGEQTDEIAPVTDRYLAGLGDEAEWQDLVLAGQSYARVERHEQSDAAYARAVALEGSDTIVSVIAWGQALRVRGENEQAAELLASQIDQKDNPDQIRFQLTGLLITMEQYERAEEVANAMARSPERDQLLIQSALSQDNQALAMERARAAVRAHPDNLALQVTLAQLLLGEQLALEAEQRDLQGILDLATQLRDRFEDRSESHAFLGNVLFNMGQGDEAINALREAYRLGPQNLQARTLLYSLLNDKSRALLRAGDQRQSILIAQEALSVGRTLSESQAGNAPFMRSMGESAAFSGDYDQSMRFYKAAFEITQEEADLAGFIRALLVLDRAAEALTELTANPELLNNSLRLRAMRGVALAAVGQPDVAAALFGNVLGEIEDGPTRRQVVEMIANAFIDEPVRIKQIVQGVLGESLAPDITVIITTALNNRRMYTESIPMIEPFISEPAENQVIQFTMLQQLGLAYQQLEQYEQAKTAYDLAYEMIVADAGVVSNYQQMMMLNNLAYMLVANMQGYDAQALEIARRAVAVMPADNLTPLQMAQILDTLGLALIRNREIDEAVEVLRRSTESEVFVDNLLHLGEAYLAKGDNNQAQLELLRARRMAEAEGDQVALERANRLLEQLEEAG